MKSVLFIDASNLISYLHKVFDNCICFIIRHDFYVISFQIHFIFFTKTFSRNKVNLYCLFVNLYFNILCARFFQMIYVFQVCFKLLVILRLIRFYFCHHYFHIQYVAPKTIYSNLFVIIFYLVFQKGLNISNYSVFN